MACDGLAAAAAAGGWRAGAGVVSGAPTHDEALAGQV